MASGQRQPLRSVPGRQPSVVRLVEREAYQMLYGAKPTPKNRTGGFGRQLHLCPESRRPGNYESV